MTYILTVISGLLATIPLKYNNFYFLAWIFLLPFLYAIDEDNLKDAFLKGWLAGTFLMMGTAYWLYHSLNNFSGFPTPVVILLLGILFIFLGSFYGLWALLYSYLNRAGVMHPFLLAISWTGLEYLRFKILPSFPLGIQAYTQTEFLYLVQLAEFGGMFLITFIIILLNGYLFKLTKQKKLRYLIPVLLIILVVVLSGRSKYTHFERENYDSIRAGIINTSISQQEKWLPSRIEEGIKLVSSAAREIAGEDKDLIITPETVLTFDLIRNEHYRNIFLQEIKGLSTPLLIGSQAIREGERGKYNSIFLLTSKGEILSRYDKNLLVIGGEYIPFSGLINRYLGLNLNSIRAGNEQNIFTTPFASWGTVICSEILYPRYGGNMGREAEFLVNQSNEAWFKRGNINQQMWSAAVFRAVENRRSVVKTGNMALAGLIAPSGRAEIKVADSSNFSARIKLNNSGPTFYQEWGNWSGYISAGIFGLLLVIKLGRQLFHRRKKAKD